jgi:TetR/AcrR family acrAB operon transcriptional repressor
VVRRTKEEALATRHRLLDAAEVLFQSRGVSRTTLQQIAQEAGATRGAIYWHFKDKPDLFNAMMERVTLPLESATREANAANEDPLAAIEQVMVQALDLMATDPQVRRVFEVATHKVEYTDEMAPVLQHAASRAGIELPIPVKTAAYGLHAVISGLIQDWLLEPGAFDLVPAGRHLFNVYLAGLGFERKPAAAGGNCKQLA